MIHWLVDVRCSYSETRAVLIAVGITGFVCLAVSIFAMQVRVSSAQVYCHVAWPGPWPAAELNLESKFVFFFLDICMSVVALCCCVITLRLTKLNKLTYLPFPQLLI